MFLKASHRPNLFKRTILPFLVLIITLVAVFTAVSSMIILNMQNRYTLSFAQQGLDYSYKSISYNIDRMSSLLQNIALNKDTENLLEGRNTEIADIVNSYYSFFQSVESISALSFNSDIGNNSANKLHYTFSTILEEPNPSYTAANSSFTPYIGPGLYKSSSVSGYPWYKALMQNLTFSIWWSEEIDNQKLMLYALRKTSQWDYRTTGILVSALDLSSLKDIIGNSVIDGTGYYLLLDQNGSIAFDGSNKKAVNPELIVSQLLPLFSEGNKSSDTFTAKIDNTPYLVMYKTLPNAWRLAAVVPEKGIKSYNIIILGIGFLAASISILIAVLIIRNISNKMLTPVKNLVSAMRWIDDRDFNKSIHASSDIFEYDHLYKGYNHMLKRINELIRDVYLKDIESKQLKLDLLQSQINPHFLYNTLDIINCSALSIGAQDISDIVLSLANVFRYGLNKGRDFILLKDELKQVSSYLEIQKLMNNRLEVEYDIQSEVMDCSVINIILQPLVENSIIHGFKKKISRCLIRISAFRKENRLIIQIYDNGSGIDTNRVHAFLQSPPADSQPGYGVSNVDKRIKLHFGAEFGITYIPIPEGTNVEITLPCIANSDDYKNL